MRRLMTIHTILFRKKSFMILYDILDNPVLHCTAQSRHPAPPCWWKRWRSDQAGSPGSPAEALPSLCIFRGLVLYDYVDTDTYKTTPPKDASRSTTTEVVCWLLPRMTKLVLHFQLQLMFFQPCLNFSKTVDVLNSMTGEPVIAPGWLVCKANSLIIIFTSAETGFQSVPSSVIKRQHAT